mgnify:FL=1
MIKTVYRDSNGTVINIGDWDYMITLDENELEITNNPLPENVKVSEEEVDYAEDGGLRVKNL